MQCLLPSTELAEQEVPPALGQRIQGLEARRLRQPLSPDQPPVALRKRVDVSQVLRAVPGVVLQVEPATHLRMTPEANPASRIQLGRLGIRGAGDAIARLRERLLSAPERAPRGRVLWQDTARQRCVE